MRLEHLEWDEWNVEHIAGHRVEPEEVESACHAERQLVRHAGITRYGLVRYHVYSQTEDGRYLFIVLDQEAPGVFYTVTAREMTESEKRTFKKTRDE